MLDGPLPYGAASLVVLMRQPVTSSRRRKEADQDVWEKRVHMRHTLPCAHLAEDAKRAVCVVVSLSCRPLLAGASPPPSTNTPSLDRLLTPLSLPLRIPAAPVLFAGRVYTRFTSQHA